MTGPTPGRPPPEGVHVAYPPMDVGSRLVIKDIDGDSILRFMNRLHDLIIARQLVHEPRADMVVRHLEDLGFRIVYRVDKLMIWYPHFILVAEKR